MRLEVERELRASPERVWDELVDWSGQDRWIPLTHVRLTGGPRAGLGARVTALSGFRLGPVPVGLLDRFVVTGWTPPGSRPGDETGELAVLHLGPYFTGEGSFKILRGDDPPHPPLGSRRSRSANPNIPPDAVGSRLVCTEVFSVPGGAPVAALLRLALPVLRRGFAASLDKFAGLVEQP